MSTTIHRFTPPTCTLEIKGKKSPLSRWTEQEILEKFQFQLSFDDPTSNPSAQVQIKGDKKDLDRLKSAVDDYLQNYLHAPFGSIANANQVNHNNQSNQLKRPKSNNPYLEPLGLTNHQLFLANLTRDNQIDKIKLSTVQLFDLVTALEAYTVQVAALPKLEQAKAKIIPLGSGVAAVAIVAVGAVSIAVWKFPSTQNVATDSAPVPAAKIPELEEIVPPTVPQAAQNPRPQPQVTEPLRSTQRLPPPPAVDSPKPKPNIPNPEDYDFSTVKKRSGLDNRPEQSSQVSKNSAPESAVNIPVETDSRSDPKQTTIDPDQESNAKIAANQPSKEQSLEQQASGEVDQSEPNQDLAIGNNSPASTDTQSKIQPNQLREVQAYFSDRWQPPGDLKQSLEYRLYFKPDGSIKRVVPLGKAAQLYLSKTNIPIQGESFVSPQPKPSTIRLLLNPDGEVKVLKES